MIISKFKRELNGDVSEIRLNTGEKLQNVEYLTDLEEKTVTENGTYTPSTGKVGFSKVVVNVSGGSSEGTTKLYVWKYTNDVTGNDYYLITPTETLTENTKVFMNDNENGFGDKTLTLIENTEKDTYYRFTENGIEYTDSPAPENYRLYTRSPSDDVNLF